MTRLGGILRSTSVALATLSLATSPTVAQVQIRVGDPTRTTYSELHEALRPGTAAAD